MGEVSVEVIWVTAFLLPPDGQRQWVGVFIRCWVAVREIEVLLEVGGFEVYGGVEMTMTQVHINVHNRDFR
jgi:hypothetical protein